jgi:hypothetical protein
MTISRPIIVVAITMGLGLSQSTVNAIGRQCPATPIEPCMKRHGRLSSQNGIGRKIWLIGTTRMVAIDSGTGNLPAAVDRYLDMASPDHSYIYGDFTICPLEVDRPGHLRRVCIAAAEKLVVQNLRRARPPFRLLSTWPKR